jgi:zinc protease
MIKMKKLHIYLTVACMAFMLFPVHAIEVVELKQPNSGKMVVKLMFRNGSICDPEGKEGLTALTAAMISEGGTSELTSSQIKDITYPWAAGWYASVDKEVTVLTFQFHKDFLKDFSDIMLGLVLDPAFAADDFSRLHSNQENYVNEVIRASSDEEYSKKALEDLLFRNTNYQHMVDGTTEGLENIKIEDVREHYLSYFTRDNLMIGVAGDFDKDYIDLLTGKLSELPEMETQLPLPGRANRPGGLQVEIISKENALGSAIFTGYPLYLTRKNDEFAALMVANSWLGEHRKSYSRLYKKIREERSMNYGDYTYIEWYENGGSNMLPPAGVPRLSNYYSIWIRPVQTGEGLRKQYEELSDIKIGHAHYAIRMALKEMQQLVDNGMPEEDFNLTRDFLRSYTKLYIQTPERQLGYLMDSRFYSRTDFIKEVDDLLADLTVEDVNDVMRKYWQTDNMFITIVTDDSEAEPLKESLLKNLPSPMSYSDALKATLPEEILKEDEQVAIYPLNVTSVDIVDSDATFRR